MFPFVFLCLLPQNNFGANKYTVIGKGSCFILRCYGGTSQEQVVDKWSNVHKTSNHWDGFFRIIIVLLIIIINLLLRKSPKPSQAFPPSMNGNSITVLVELNLLIFCWEIFFFIYLFLFYALGHRDILPEGTKWFYLKFCVGLLP